jgi:hypothetical protein
MVFRKRLRAGYDKACTVEAAKSFAKWVCFHPSYSNGARSLLLREVSSPACACSLAEKDACKIEIEKRRGK